MKKEERLSSAVIKQISKAIGKCEISGKKEGLQVHHIKELNQGGRNTQSNLIVLCYYQHIEVVHAGRVTIAKLKKIVKKRPDKLKKEIANIIRNSKKKSTKKKSDKPKKDKPKKSDKKKTKVKKHKSKKVKSKKKKKKKYLGVVPTDKRKKINESTVFKVDLIKLK